MTILEKLMHVQQETKAPKNRRNNFGGYSYRSAEDILEAVKPALEKYKATITLADEIVEVGTRIYIMATARFMDAEKTASAAAAGEDVTVTAYAREAETKKGMDDSQITGTASSYARKYALNGLLLLDDTEDADAGAPVQDADGEKHVLPLKKLPKNIVDDLKQLATKAGIDLVAAVTTPLEDLSREQAEALRKSLEKRIQQ